MNLSVKKQATDEEIPTVHWADHAATDLVTKHPDKVLVCASGISPSGVVHIGNFREVITVDLVVRALRDRNRKVRFIYVWDEYDALRKVPAGLPNQEMISKNLRKPLSHVPDPFGDCPSYAKHFERTFEKEISQLGIHPEYIYQSERYRNGEYAEGIHTALAHQRKIREILNNSRTEPLPEDWSCVSIFCKQCDRDTTELLEFRPPHTFRYRCHHCKVELETHMEAEGGVKLLWRVDWPMRWAKESVDFEPGGKDHSSQGGSFQTGAEIIRAIWKKEPPHYLQYDFVLAKGIGAKLSSSKGQLITLGEALAVYEPQVVRWIFASRKPNMDFSIAFDLDVMKAYDDFDRSERFAYGAELAEEKRVRYERRIYELSQISPQPLEGNCPAQYPFRHLCNILQVYEGNIEKAKLYYEKSQGSAFEGGRYQSRAERAWKWITTFAPQEFRFSIRLPLNPPPKSKYPGAVGDLIHLLQEAVFPTLKEEEVASRTYEIIKKHQVVPKLFFEDIYSILVDKTSGPKLASFLLSMGSERATEILKKSL